MCPAKSQFVGRFLLAACALAVTVGCGDDGGGSTTPTSPTTTTPATQVNRPPTTSGTIPGRTLAVGASATVDVSQYFSDPDGDALAYEATSSNTHVATVSVSDSTVTLTASNLGSANVRVTARDPDGLTATQSFSLTVEQPPNRPPEISRRIPDRTLNIDEDETASIDLNRYFTDADGDTLTYEATSSNSHVATVSVSGSRVTLRARHLGRADIRVTARDPDGLAVTQRFSVTVEQNPAEAEVTRCSARGSLGDQQVTIEGFVRARRQLRSVTVTGWVVAEIFQVGTVDLGDIPAGHTRNFRIEDEAPTIVTSSSRCGVRVRWSDAASAPLLDAERAF